MASEAERDGVPPERTRRWLERLMGSGGNPERGPFVSFPIIVGVVGPGSGVEGQEAEHIVLVSPLTQGAVLLGSGGGGTDLAALLQGILAAEGGPPPASKASIEELRRVERGPEGGQRGAEEDDEEECVVCLDGLWTAAGAEGEQAGGEVKEMPCRHRFHGGCIEKWLGLHGSCPVCRYLMPAEERDGGKKGREEGEEAATRRAALEREIWAALGFISAAAARDDGERQQGDPEELQQPTEETD